VFRSGHKESPRLMQAIQAREIEIAAIHHVDRPGLKQQLIEGFATLLGQVLGELFHF
jgi:hypothetical protein